MRQSRESAADSVAPRHSDAAGKGRIWAIPHTGTSGRLVPVDLTFALAPLHIIRP